MPDKRKVIDSFRTLSDRLGPSHLCWRYDPVLLWGNYDINYHIRAFSTLAEALEGYTYTCIFSFIDLYGKTLRNFPVARRVSHENQLFLVEKFVDIAGKHILRSPGSGYHRVPHKGKSGRPSGRSPQNSFL